MAHILYTLLELATAFAVFMACRYGIRLVAEKLKQ
jgi:hypothetical protein